MKKVEKSDDTLANEAAAKAQNQQDGFDAAENVLREAVQEDVERLVETPISKIIADITSMARAAVLDEARMNYLQMIGMVKTLAKKGDYTNDRELTLEVVGWNQALEAVGTILENQMKLLDMEDASFIRTADAADKDQELRWFWMGDQRDGWCGDFVRRDDAIEDALDAGMEEIELARFHPDQMEQTIFEYDVSPVHLVLTDEDGMPLEDPIEQVKQVDKQTLS